MNCDKGNVQRCKWKSVASLIFLIEAVTELPLLLLVKTSARLLTDTAADNKVKPSLKQHTRGMSLASHDHSSCHAGQAGPFFWLASEAAKKLACWCLHLAYIFGLCYRSLSSHGHKSCAPCKEGPSSFRARFQSPVTPASASGSHHELQTLFPPSFTKR